MTAGRCTVSVFRPSQSDFVNIWLFLGFAAYEWSQCIFVIAKIKKYYDLPNDTDYNLVFLCTFGVAISMTATAIYLIYYPISEKVKRRLETINLQFILVMGYLLLFAFIGS